MSITVMGLSVTQFPQSANPNFKRAKLDVLWNHADVDSPKIVRKAIGRTSEAPFGKEPPAINIAYAEKLISSKALVSGQEYEVETSFNDEEMSMEITKLVACDPQIQKHMEESLKAYKG